jgi:hypothetical protein
MRRHEAAYACHVRHMNSDRLGAAPAVTVIGAFVAGLAVVSVVLPRTRPAPGLPTASGT